MYRMMKKLGTSNNLVYAFIILIFFLLAFRWYYILNRYAVNFLFSDQWLFFTPLFEEENWWVIFNWQHGPHRQGLGFLITSWLMYLTDWDTVQDSYYIATVFILATALVLVLKWRLFSKLNIFDVTIPVLCLSLVNYETIIITPNSSHSIFPFFLLCILGCSFTLKNDWMKQCLIGLLTAFLIFTGFGLFAGIVIPLILIWYVLCRLLRHDLRAVIAPTLSFLFVACMIALFVKGYHLLPIKNKGYQLWDYCYYISMMFTGYFQIEDIKYNYLGLFVLFLVISIGLYSFLKMIKEGENANIIYVITFLFSTFTILYCSATAMGRMHFGLQNAQASRHMILLLPALLSCYFYCQLLSKNLLRRFTLTILLIWVALTCIPLSGFHRGIIQGFQTGKIHWIQAYLKTQDIIKAENISGLSLNIHPIGGNLGPKIEYLRRNGLNFFKDKRVFPVLKKKKGV